MRRLGFRPGVVFYGYCSLGPDVDGDIVGRAYQGLSVDLLLDFLTARAPLAGAGALGRMRRL